MPDIFRRFNPILWFRQLTHRLSRFIRDLVDRLFPASGPSISSISPTEGHAGTEVTIQGLRFAMAREDNDVSFGGAAGRVVAASETQLTVIVEAGTDTGAVTVEVAGDTDTGPIFTIMGYPSAAAGEDGPPIYFAGTGSPAAATGGVSPTGTANVLVTLVHPTDRIPANATTLRQDVIDIWEDVTTFFEQASFNALTVDVDVMSAWHKLSGTESVYVKTNSEPGYPNIDWGVIDRLLAEAAQAAEDDGFDLDDYDMMATIVNLNGTFIRAWASFTRQNFKYKNTAASLDIDITLKEPLSQLVVGENADWGRCAHEFAHNVVDSSGASIKDAIGAVTLGEDVYSSDLIDPSEATADEFEMMGSHDDHPLFSGYFMDQLGYYDDSDAKHIRILTWDRNPTTKTFKIAAHGLSRNTAADRCHAVRIEVAKGLYYYIEVRQKPGTTTQVFDDSIPIGTAPNDGGVVITRVLTDVVNQNQQTRFITLLHDTRVLKNGESAIDPARDLTITVKDDGLVTRPLVCEVKVEWAQTITADPNGKFDLRFDPWDSTWQTPDVWVDRMTYGTFDKSKDSAGRPKGNGDKPRPGEINRFYTRIHNDGADPAGNVKVTFYSVEPPGVGDNGSWSPLTTATVGNIAANDSEDIYANWVPVVNRHTCLKVYAQQQLGEISGGNNSAQENVFDFEAAASSVPDAVTMPVAVRNPLDRRVLVHLRPSRVPAGYAVHFPHRWVWLDPKAERNFAMTVIPTEDYGWYQDFKDENMTTDISLRGDVPRGYDEQVGATFPASWAFPIGGVTMSVTPKRRVSLAIEGGDEGDGIYVRGNMSPGLAGESVRVDFTDPYGYVQVADTTTDSSGSFGLFYSLGKAQRANEELVTDRDHLPPGHPGVFPVWGLYRVQGHTINSPNATEASSNIITVDIPVP